MVRVLGVVRVSRVSEGYLGLALALALALALGLGLEFG